MIIIILENSKYMIVDMQDAFTFESGQAVQILVIDNDPLLGYYIPYSHPINPAPVHGLVDVQTPERSHFREHHLQ